MSRSWGSAPNKSGAVQQSLPMATRRTTPQPPDPPLALTVARSEAGRKIQIQIDRGRQIAGRRIASDEDLTQARHERDRWVSFCTELLKKMFTNGTIAVEFSEYVGGVTYVNAGLDFYARSFVEEINEYMNRLVSIAERLELIDEPRDARPLAEARVGTTGDSRKVFVVHGRDEARRESVARFLTKLELIPIILHEQPSRGGTVIEKIGANADVEFAVVILTGDDVGALKGDEANLLPRARQNVIAELGYFVGRIGREKVCALYEHGVELPSDFAGVVYVSLAQGWELAVAKEIRAAGIPVDLNHL